MCHIHTLSKVTCQIYSKINYKLDIINYKLDGDLYKYVIYKYLLNIL